MHNHPDLRSYLRQRYTCDRLSLAELRIELGVGREHLRRMLAAAGIVIRAQGACSEAARTKRALSVDNAAAAQVGTNDIRAWMHQRRSEGWTIERISAAVGRSAPWVRGRLQPNPTQRSATSTAPESRPQETQPWSRETSDNLQGRDGVFVRG